MSEGLHLPHGHGRLPAWGWWLIGGLAVYLLIRRGKNSVADMVVPGGGQSQALASDVNPRQAQAEQLQLEQLKKQFAFQDAFTALELKNRTAQSAAVADYADFYHSLASGQPYASGGIKCPSGKPRIDPVTGRIYCREKAGGGFHWDDALKIGVDIWKTVTGLPSGGKTQPAKTPTSSGAGGWSTASYTGGGSVVSPASVLWCDGIDC